MPRKNPRCYLCFFKMKKSNEPASNPKKWVFRCPKCNGKREEWISDKMRRFNEQQKGGKTE